MTIKELANFYKSKNEHYEVSDVFVKAGYQQKSGGYISKAKKIGLEVDYKKAEPNQKWHLLESYIPEKQESNLYNHLIICPELLLWMAEAAEIDTNIIREAEKKARKIIDAGRQENKEGLARNKAGLTIREIITWGMIENKIESV